LIFLLCLVLCSCSSPPPRSSSLFPYTTLFRSREVGPQQRSLTERRHPAMVRNNLGGRVTLLGLGVLGLVGSALVSVPARVQADSDRKSTRLNSSHGSISYAVFCLKKKNTIIIT